MQLTRIPSCPACDPQQDQDGDGVCDDEDNCLSIPNPDQRDSDEDGFGNGCDTDYNDDLAVGIPDFGLFSPETGKNWCVPAYDPQFDANGDNVIGIPDFAVLLTFLGQPPGPSGLSCAGVTVPCP